MTFVFLWRNLTLSFTAILDMYFQNLSLLSKIVLYVVREVRFLDMIFDERLIWVPHLRSLRLACQSPLDLLGHLSHTTWGADRNTLLRLYLVLVRWIMVPMYFVLIPLVPSVFWTLSKTRACA